MVSALSQTLETSYVVMPAASQSARVSGCGVSSAANAYPPQAKPNVNARTSTGDLIAIPPSDDGILTIPHSNFTLQHSFCGPEQGRDATKYQVKDSKRGLRGSNHDQFAKPWKGLRGLAGPLFRRPCCRGWHAPPSRPLRLPPAGRRGATTGVNLLARPDAAARASTPKVE